jgi:signal transduction histidine kinase
VEGVAEARSVRLLVDAPGDGVRVRGNRGLLLRAVRNLVVNAVEAVEPGGSVGVVVRPLGERVLVSVWDDGPGIAPEHFPALFRRPFTTRADGSGLGLLLVRQVVEGVHGGTVSQQPRTPRGSIFRIELPRLMSAGEAA